MKALSLDRSSGLTGDMLVGALCALGVKPSALEWELSKLDLGDFHMHFEKKTVGDQEGIRFTIHEGSTHTHEQDEHEHGPEDDHTHDHGHTHVHADGTICHHDHSHEATHGHAEEARAHDEHEHSHEEHSHAHGDEHVHEHANEEEPGHAHHHAPGRTSAEVQELIAASDLSPFVKAHALSIFTLLGSKADASATTLAPIAEVVCTCVGLEALGVQSFIVPAALEDQAATTGDAIVAEFGQAAEVCSSQGKIGYGAGESGGLLLQACLCEE